MLRKTNVNSTKCVNTNGRTDKIISYFISDHENAIKIMNALFILTTSFRLCLLKKNQQFRDAFRNHT